MNNLNHSSGNSISPEEPKPSQKKKEDLFLDRYRLTPSEIESLRKRGEKISLQARGKFKHLFEKND